MFPYIPEIEPYYKQCRRLLEVGVGDVWSSTLWPWIQSGEYDFAMLVDANPRLASEVRNTFQNHPKIRIRHGAIAEKAGEKLTFDDFGQGSHAQGIAAPRLHDEKTKDVEHPTFTVETMRLEEVDKGTFDFVNIDVEGMEAVVIEQLVSRPKVLILETHSYLSSYVTPNIEGIFQRVLGWGYTIRAIRGMETIFIKP